MTHWPHRVTVVERRGSVLTLLAVALVALIGFTVLAVDIGLVATERAQAQVAADAAAFAALQELDNEAQVVAEAQEYAALNYPTAGSDLQVTAEVGVWDEDAKQFTVQSGNGIPNAVQVTVRRESSPMLFAQLFGNSSVEISATAIAVDEVDELSTSGIVAGNRAVVLQNVVQDNFIVYGRNGVRYSRNPTLLNGSLAGALDETFVDGPRSLIGFIFEARIEPVLADNSARIVDDLINEVNLPPQIQDVEHIPSGETLPADLENGTAYVLEDDLTIEQVYEVSDVIIASRGNILWGPNGGIRNTGDATDGVAIGVIALGNIQLGQGAIADGVELIALNDVRLLHGIITFSGTVQGGGLVAIGPENTIRGTTFKGSVSVSGFAGRSALAR